MSAWPRRSFYCARGRENWSHGRPWQKQSNTHTHTGMNLGCLILILCLIKPSREELFSSPRQTPIPCLLVVAIFPERDPGAAKLSLYCTRKCEGGVMSAFCHLQPPCNGSNGRVSLWKTKLSQGTCKSFWGQIFAWPWCSLRKFRVTAGGPDKLYRCELPADGRMLTWRLIHIHISWYNTIGGFMELRLDHVWLRLDHVLKR